MDITEKLQKGMNTIVWDREFEKGKKWTVEMRQNQASVLKEVMAIERKALHKMEKIVRGIN